MKKEIIICNKCKNQVNKNEYITIDVLLGEQDRIIAEQTSKELEIVQQIDLCRNCCAVIIKRWLSNLNNSIESLEKMEFLRNNGVKFQ